MHKTPLAPLYILIAKRNEAWEGQYFVITRRGRVAQKECFVKHKSFGGWATATAILLVVLCLLAGCQSAAVPITYTQAARWDLSGINRIGIESNNPQVGNSLAQSLSAAKYTVVSGSELALAKRESSATAVTAAALTQAYGANVARADGTYGKKILKITGVVNKIDASAGHYFIRLTGTGSDSVVAYLAPSETSKAASVNVGQTTTIIGECYGRSTPNDEGIAEILRILGAGDRVNIVDATFPVGASIDAVVSLSTGSSVQTSSRKENQKVGTDADGNAIYQEVTVTYYDATATINYNIVRLPGDSVIGNGAGTGKSGNQSESSTAVTRAISSAQSAVISDIVPTQKTVNVTLAKEPENKEAKTEMAEAEKLVKAKDYKDAAAAYGTIYGKYKNFAAGYNQAVLTEATSGTAAAIVLMDALFKSTTDDTNKALAQKTLGEMQGRNASNQRAASQSR